MKLRSVVRTSLVAVACMSFMLGTAAGADSETKARFKGSREAEKWQSTPQPKVILVEVTGSRIPQRVVLHGQQVNSASALRVFGGNELMRTGATNVAGIVALDPSVTFVRR